jgi:hypothetical protein
MSILFISSKSKHLMHLAGAKFLKPQLESEQQQYHKPLVNQYELLLQHNSLVLRGHHQLIMGEMQF